MPSSRTLNRARKVELLKESFHGILDVMLMEHKARDRVNMSHFKELSRQVKSMQALAK